MLFLFDLLILVQMSAMKTTFNASVKTAQLNDGTLTL